MVERMAKRLVFCYVLAAVLAAALAPIALLILGSAGTLTLEFGMEPETNPSRLPLGRAGVSVSGSGVALTPRQRAGRFPEMGTAEFSDRCGWTGAGGRRFRQSKRRGDDANCTFHYGPSARENEGLAWWAAQVVSSHLLAIQAGCRILIDYGPGVNVGDVLIPASPGGLDDWRVPDGFECAESDGCHEIPHSSGAFVLDTNATLTFEMPGRGGRGTALAAVPRYRYSYESRSYFPRDPPDLFGELERALPGFALGSGMACSLGSLFRLAPGAARHEPRLFDSILPALRDEGALVMGIYIRTGLTDAVRSQLVTGGQEVSVGPDVLERYKKYDANLSLSCALELETRYLSGTIKPENDFSRIIWMLSTDSPDIKRWVTDTYGGQDANARVPLESRKWKSRRVPREVLTTGSRGAHTRISDGNVSTADFAEAVVDWYLLGESDLVIYNRYSFGTTAALRTARPVYKWVPKRGHKNVCEEIPLVREASRRHARRPRLNIASLVERGGHS